jgi:hypothetical protein
MPSPRRPRPYASIAPATACPIRSLASGSSAAETTNDGANYWLGSPSCPSPDADTASPMLRRNFAPSEKILVAGYVICLRLALPMRDRARHARLRCGGTRGSRVWRISTCRPGRDATDIMVRDTQGDLPLNLFTASCDSPRAVERA